MENEETVNEKVDVKDVFSASPFPRHANDEAEPTMPADEAELQEPLLPSGLSASDQDIPLYPPQEILKSSEELNAESARREDGE